MKEGMIGVGGKESVEERRRREGKYGSSGGRGRGEPGRGGEEERGGRVGGGGGGGLGWIKWKGEIKLGGGNRMGKMGGCMRWKRGVGCRNFVPLFSPCATPPLPISITPSPHLISPTLSPHLICPPPSVLKSSQVQFSDYISHNLT